MGPIRKYATTSEQRIRMCLDLGMSVNQAAKALNVSPRMLHHTVSVLGLSPHGHKTQRSRTASLVVTGPHNPFGLTTTEPAAAGV